MKYFIIILYISFSICEDENSFSEKCLNKNDKDSINSLTLRACLELNKELTKEDKIYCCYMKIIKNKNDIKKYCITADYYNRDSIENRIEMLKLQDKNIKEVTIECSSNYLYLTILFVFLFII